MDRYAFSFERLEVWKLSREFVKDMYQISKGFPDEERFGLTNQLRRSAVSIAANIAEGVSRTSKKDQANFSQLSFSSLMEVLNHLYLAYDLKYIERKDLSNSRKKIIQLSKMLSGLRNYQKSTQP